LGSEEDIADEDISVRDYVKRAAGDAWLEIQSDHRGIIHAAVAGGHPVFITGGMSWGDNPSDSWDPVCLLAELGICSEPMPWAQS
jgi:hypothetical protein